MLDVLELSRSDPVLPRCGTRRACSRRPARLVISVVPAFRILWTNHDVINHHRTRYTKPTFRTPRPRRGGFCIDREEHWFQWTCPAKIATGLAERVFRIAPSLPTVPPAWINRPLHTPSRVERRVLGPLRPPFGSSLLVVCRAESDGPLEPMSDDR